MDIKSLVLVLVAATFLLHNVMVCGKNAKKHKSTQPKKVCKPGVCNKIDYKKLVKKQKVAAAPAKKGKKSGGPEFRVKGFTRSGEDYVAYFNQKNISLGKWSVTDSCPVDTFGDTGDLIFDDELEYLEHIAIGCFGVKRPPNTPRDVIESEALGPRAVDWTPCRGYPNVPKNALLVGIGFATQKPDDYHDHALTGLNFYCGNYNRIWTLSSPKSIRWNDVVCSPGNAVCAIESQFDKGTGNSYTTNVRIGCCSVPTEYWKNSFVHITEKTHDEIFVLQTRGGENPPLFGVTDPKTPFYHIYNRYVSQLPLTGGTTFTHTQCAKGSYVSGFEVTNPSSTYYNGDLIYKIGFTCSNAETNAITSTLDHYKPFKNEFKTIRESRIHQTFTCKDGQYDAAILTYYYESTFENLVEGWSFAMHCSENDADQYDTVADLTAKPGKFDERGIVNCGYNFAICGFSTAPLQGRVGTPEGVFMKVICCVMIR